MYLTEKDITYADLVVPFVKCPFDEVDNDCPFIQYWKLSNMNEQINSMKNLSEKKLDKLREHHRFCISNKIRQLQEGK